MLRRPHNRTVNKDMRRDCQLIGRKMRPELLPDVALLPTAEAVRDGVPFPKLGGKIPPWDPRAGDVQHGLDTHPVTLPGWAARLMLDFIQNDREFLPRGIRQDPSSLRHCCSSFAPCRRRQLTIT